MWINWQCDHYLTPLCDEQQWWRAAGCWPAGGRSGFVLHPCAACFALLWSSDQLVGPLIHKSPGPTQQGGQATLPFSSLGRPALKANAPLQVTYISARLCPHGDLSCVCSLDTVLAIYTPPSGISAPVWRTSGLLSPGLPAFRIQPWSPTRCFTKRRLLTHKCPCVVSEGFRFEPSYELLLKRWILSCFKSV